MNYLDFPTADSPEGAVRQGIFQPISNIERTEKDELELELFGHGGGWRGGGGGRRQCVCYRAARPLTPMRRGLLGALLGAHGGASESGLVSHALPLHKSTKLIIFSFLLTTTFALHSQHCSLPPRFLQI